MKNKGFTLIELLAVIVILAIIALIAVPIILSIIGSAKNSAVLRSGELYLKGVETAISRKNLNEQFNPVSCIIGNDGNLTCDGESTLIVEVSGSKPTNGTIGFTNGKITFVENLILDGYKLKKENGKLKIEGQVGEPVNPDVPQPSVPPIGVAVTEENKSSVGTVPTGEFKPGDEYIVQVNNATSHHFYVLSDNGDDTINLIMSENICSDGTLAPKTNVCVSPWLSEDDYQAAAGSGNYDSDTNIKGPITAMNYLAQATSDWTNIPNITINYKDEGKTDNYGYSSIETNGTITKIIALDGTITANYENLKARLPINSELSSVGCTSENDSCPGFVTNGLEFIMSDSGVGGILDYWTLSSKLSSNNEAITVSFFKKIDNHYVYYNGTGIRPVITLSKSDLS